MSEHCSYTGPHAEHTFDSRPTKLCPGVEASNVIQFHRPENFKYTPCTTAPVAPQQEVTTSAVDLLKQVAAQGPADLKDVLIVTQDNSGATGLLTTLDGQSEVLLMLEQVKAKIIQNSMGDAPQPNRSA